MIKGRIISILLVSTILSGLLLLICHKTFFFPVSIAVEMKCDTICQVQVFFPRFNSQSGGSMDQKSYS